MNRTGVEQQVLKALLETKKENRQRLTAYLKDRQQELCDLTNRKGNAKNQLEAVDHLLQRELDERTSFNLEARRREIEDELSFLDYPFGQRCNGPAAADRLAQTIKETYETLERLAGEIKALKRDLHRL